LDGTLAGVPLKIAAKVDPIGFREYFDSKIQLSDNPLVEFIGAIGYPEKNHSSGECAGIVVSLIGGNPLGWW